MTVQLDRVRAIALVGGLLAMVWGASVAHADFLGLDSAQSDITNDDFAAAAVGLPAASDVLWLSQDQGRCRVTWSGLEPVSVLWTVVDDMEMPQDATCVGLVASNMDTALVAAQGEDGAYHLAWISRADMSVMVALSLPLEAVSQPGALFAFGPQRVAVAGANVGGGSLLRYDVGVSDITLGYQRDLATEPCLENVVAVAPFASGDVALASACGEEGVGAWTLDEAGEPTQAMLAEAGTFRPEAVIAGPGGFYAVGASLTEGEPSGVSWKLYNTEMGMSTVSVDLADSMALAGDKKWISVGADGIYVLTATQEAATGLFLFSPEGALLGAASELPSGAVRAFEAHSQGGAWLYLNGESNVVGTRVMLVVDGDGDGVGDDDDNCPADANADQADADMDGVGDACDDAMGSDADMDGVDDADDNCPADANPEQADADEDGLGDACDVCPMVADADQADADMDGEGDACDADIDGDEINNADDNCPMVANADQADADNNGVGDACQPENDMDGDGVEDDADNCPTSSNPGQGDLDEDGQGDACDGDIDGDGVYNSRDNCPTVRNFNQRDRDFDGIGDVCDTDRDGDGVEDDVDSCPNAFNENSDQDRDGIDSACDPDIDGDGINNGADNCPRVVNRLQEDRDSDGKGDECDDVLNVLDADNDDIPDALDNCPQDSNPDQFDIDRDGSGDVCDQDRDGDGVANGSDNCPDANNPTQSDSDGDGIGDACEDLIPDPIEVPEPGEVTDDPRQTPGLPVPPIDNGNCSVPGSLGQSQPLWSLLALVGLALVARRRRD